MKRLKILQIFNRYLQYGGEEGSVYRIADALKEQHDVENFLTSSSSLEASGFAKLKAYLYTLWNLEVSKQLEQDQNLRRYDVWQIHNVFPTMSPVVYKKAFDLGVPVIQYLHNYRMSCVNGYFLNNGSTCERCIGGNFLPALTTACWRESHIFSGTMGMLLYSLREMGAFQKIAAWIALSTVQKEQHVRMGIPEEKIHLVPHFYELDRNTNIKSNGKYVIFIGRLSKEKGVHLLLDAWASLNSSTAQLVIMGEGPESIILQNKAKKLDIKNVIFTGFLSKKEQEHYWNQAAFIVVPSIWHDPFPTVVFEAWERGCPVVASNMGGLRDIITDGEDGLLFNCEDPTSLVDALETMFLKVESWAKMAAAGRAKITNQYSKALWLKKIEEVYQKVSNK